MGHYCEMILWAEIRVLASPGKHFVVALEVQWPIVSQSPSGPGAEGYAGAWVPWMHVQSEGRSLVGEMQPDGWQALLCCLDLDEHIHHRQVQSASSCWGSQETHCQSWWEMKSWPRNPIRSGAVLHLGSKQLLL